MALCCSFPETILILVVQPHSFAFPPPFGPEVQRQRQLTLYLEFGMFDNPRQDAIQNVPQKRVQGGGPKRAGSDSVRSWGEAQEEWVRACRRGRRRVEDMGECQKDCEISGRPTTEERRGKKRIKGTRSRPHGRWEKGTKLVEEGKGTGNGLEMWMEMEMDWQFGTVR